jgi:hypothetical protein
MIMPKSSIQMRICIGQTSHFTYIQEKSTKQYVSVFSKGSDETIGLGWTNPNVYFDQTIGGYLDAVLILACHRIFLFRLLLLGDVKSSLDMTSMNKVDIIVKLQLISVQSFAPIHPRRVGSHAASQRRMKKSS